MKSIPLIPLLLALALPVGGCAQKTAMVTMKNPATGERVECGPYATIPSEKALNRNAMVRNKGASAAASAAEMSCVRDHQKHGFVVVRDQ